MLEGSHKNIIIFPPIHLEIWLVKQWKEFV